VLIAVDGYGIQGLLPLNGFFFFIDIAILALVVSQTNSCRGIQ
jgi:hypothetical protein